MKNAVYPVYPLILERWSPRAFSGEALGERETMTLFEAARWAPSQYNNQSWRFVYARRETAAWKPIFDTLVPFNQSWVVNAALLIVVCSKTLFEFNGKPCSTHAFDAGAAAENLALQAWSMGLYAHGMSGFDDEAAGRVIKLPADHVVNMMIAVGKPGEKAALPADLQAREERSDRKPLSEIIREGSF